MKLKNCIYLSIVCDMIDTKYYLLSRQSLISITEYIYSEEEENSSEKNKGFKLYSS